MARGGGKGRVSNNLVAASCAAVLSVYAAGYWRTREEARRFDMRAEERKAVRPESPAATAAQPARIAAVPAPAPAPSPPEAPRTISPPTVKAAPPSPVASQPAATAPAVETNVAPAVVTSQIESPPAPIPAITAAAPPAPAANWRDGTYTAWGTSRHGDLKVRVVIKNGRIVESSIDSCETAYPCDVITSIFHQPVERQSADVDRVSRATESADAYYYGVLYALKDALVQPPEEATPPQ